MLLAEPIQITQKIVEIFECLQISYFIGGSLASSLHGIPRATQDVDIIADIKNYHVRSLIKELQKEFYVSEDMIGDALQRHASFNIIHLETMFKVDVFILKDDSVSQEEMARKKKFIVFEKELYLATAEDTILQKLRWYKLGHKISERQWNDVIGVLKVQKNQLDYEYLQYTAEIIGVSELLEEAFVENRKTNVH